jgi:hypothetical protein
MPRLLRGIARTAVIAGTATAVSNRVSRRQAGRWAEQDAPPDGSEQPVEPAPAMAAAPVPAQPPATDAGSSMDRKLAQLKDLGELKAQGVLSQEEFDTQKQRILAG